MKKHVTILIIAMYKCLKKGNKKLKYNHGEKSIKYPFIIYADLECLLEKMSTCPNNPEKSSTTKINMHTPSGYSLFTNCWFDVAGNKLDCYRGKDCMEKFFKNLMEHATKIINYEKKRNNTTNWWRKQVLWKAQSFLQQKKFSADYDNKVALNKKYQKIRDHCHYIGKFRGAAHSISNLWHKTPNEIPVVSHKGSTYDYQFIIKQLAKELDSEVECLGENIKNILFFYYQLKKNLITW